MKNKRLTFVVSLLAIYLIGAFCESKVTNSKKETVTVGVLQFVSHPALDEIYKGVEEGLKENGYDKGKNLEIIFQNGQADQSKLAIMSQQLVQKGRRFNWYRHARASVSQHYPRNPNHFRRHYGPC